MLPFNDEIENIRQQLIEKFNPRTIILFGSCAKGCARKSSDIDICVILDYEDKRQMRRLLEENIESEKDIDFILYRPNEWEVYKNDTTTFANLILRTGIILYS